MKSLILILVYSFVYQFIHVNFLYKVFYYAGYIAEDFSLISLLQTLFFILIPLKLKKRVSSDFFLEVLYTITYFLLYIPLMITFLNHYKGFWLIIDAQIPFLIGYLVLFGIPCFKKISVVKFNLNPPKISMLVFSVFLIVGYLYIVNKEIYGFVSFEDVYSQREKGISRSIISGYFTLWLTYFFGPIIVSIGLANKSIVTIVIGIVSVIFVYGINASKIALFIPFLIIFFFLIKKSKQDVLDSVAVLFSAICIVTYLLPEQFNMISAVILMRTFGIPGLLTFQYLEFFKTNPQTYFSHINLINFFTDSYPYKQDLGFVVSSFFFESDNNANANFWATDGVGFVYQGGSKEQLSDVVPSHYYHSIGIIFKL